MLLNDLPFRFEPSKRYGEDYLLWLNILLSGYAGAIIEFELGYRHKQWYGFSGLSAKLWDMEKKEITPIINFFVMGKFLFPFLCCFHFFTFKIHKARF
jgi:hypothetical protein